MSATPDQLYATAQELQSAGRLRDAESLYRQVLAIEPAHSDACHRLGIVLHHLGQTPEAIEMLRQATGLKPAAADFHSNLGVVLAAVGRFGEALDAFQTSLSLGAN